MSALVRSVECTDFSLTWVYKMATYSFLLVALSAASILLVVASFVSFGTAQTRNAMFSFADGVSRAPWQPLRAPPSINNSVSPYAYAQFMQRS